MQHVSISRSLRDCISECSEQVFIVLSKDVDGQSGEFTGIREPWGVSKDGHHRGRVLPTALTLGSVSGLVFRWLSSSVPLGLNGARAKDAPLPC